VSNDCEIRLAVSQLLNRSFWIIKGGILVHAGTTLSIQPPGVSKARLSLNLQDCIINGATVNLDVLMVRPIEGSYEKMGVDASFWRREQGGEDGIFIEEVVV
jgi:hypothetical protein